MPRQQPRYRIRNIAAYVGVLSLLVLVAVLAFFAIEDQAHREMLRDEAQSHAQENERD